MFTNAASDVLVQDSCALGPPLDYYIESEPIISAHEDLAEATGISVRLGDLGVGKCLSSIFCTLVSLNNR